MFLPTFDALVEELAALEAKLNGAAG